MMLAICFFFWIFHFTNGIETDLSMLTLDQAKIWLNAVSQIKNTNQDSRIEIVRLGDTIDISVYKNDEGIPSQNRNVFKQNINKRIDSYLYQNQINSSYISNIYDSCHGTLSSREVLPDIAGTYVYTGNQTSYDLGLILVEIANSYSWFNNTKSYLVNRSSTIRNGTQLSLAFQCNIYYNSNSDLISLNNKINEIVAQANPSIKSNGEDNLEMFLSMENLSCRRHKQIVDDDLRLLAIACTTKVTFKCPLKVGSTCWIENKLLSNIQFNIDSNTFPSTKTITVRIDV